jgi:ATP-dependent Clp protease ATP-binding subunit ClpA
LKRLIQDKIQNELANLILSNKFKPGQNLNIGMKEDNLEFMVLKEA